MTDPRHPANPPPRSVTDEQRPPHAPGSSMRFSISHVGNYLRGDLYERKTAEETREFLQAVAAAALEKGVDRVLISVHASRPIFRVQQLDLPQLFATMASRPAHRVATVADTFEGRLAQQYVVMLARQRGLNVRSFRAEGDAIAWLQS